MYFTGATCATDLRPCSVNPCMNNGTCIQNITDITNPSYYCDCGQYYEGIFCQTKIDVCKNETCSRQGSCIDVDNQPKCVCFNSYLGDKCDTLSESLKTTKRVVTTASVIAILTLIALYSSFVLCDIHKFFFMNRDKGSKINKIRKNKIFNIEFFD